MALTGRLPVTACGIVAALTTGIAGTALGAQATTGIAWAVLAGFGLSLMLHGRAMPVIGVITGVLAVLGGVVGAGEQPWLIAGFAVAFAAAAAMAWKGPSWAHRSPVRQHRGDMWSAFDEGEDPTL